MTLPTACPKPEKSSRVERHERRQQRKKASDDVKSAAKKRDQFQCRWPPWDCDCRRIKQPLDGAHIEAAGMGGDKQLKRTTRKNIVSLCRTMHGVWHRGLAKVEPVNGDEGADGACSYWRWNITDGWYMVARERSFKVWERD